MRFINRTVEIQRLRAQLELFQKGEWDNTCHLALLGLRRTGKTFLIKHFLDHAVEPQTAHRVYLDLSKSANSPRDFAQSMVRAALQAAAHSRSEEFLDLGLQVGGEDLIRAVDRFQRVTLASGDNAAMLNAAFTVFRELPDAKWVVALDEFQDILGLERFRGIDSMDALFRANLQELENVFFLISGSFPTIMKNWLSDESKYLFSHFSVIQISELTREASFELVTDRLGSVSLEVKRQLYTHTYGNPYLLSVFAREYRLRERPIDEIFKEQVFDSSGVIYNYFSYLLDQSLKLARGEGVLKETLKIMCLAEEPLSAPAISAELGKSLEEVHAALKELIRVDLIQCHERRYTFRVVPFKYFLRYRYLGLEQYEYERNTFLRSQVARLMEAYNRTSSELGRTKEFEIYYHVAGAQGKQLWGMKIPRFRTMEKNAHTDRGEVDLLATTPRGKRWAFELKWRNKACGVREVRALQAKTDADRYVMLSRSGFTAQAHDSFGADPAVALIDLGNPDNTSG
ncbi:MAG: hypothetical protein HN919_09010 [Verrucomicrobia bacterium]|jgi:hypothetical protein|nr:hypothetical protein [Verrucomicrobiota bacterium]